MAISTVLVGAAALLIAGSADAAQSWGKGKIAFMSTRDGTGDVFVMHDDGSHQRNLTNGRSAGADAPAISPNGQSIAFTAYDTDGGAEVYVISADGGKIHKLTHEKYSGSVAAWSPNSKKIAYVCVNKTLLNLCVINVASGHVEHLTHGDHRVYTPTWSPDGDRIAFADYDAPAGQSEIWTVHSNGSHPRQLTKTAAVPELAPAWSPDGKRIAVDTEYYGIQFISATTGDPIGSTFAGHDPSWSPDGKRVDYVGFDGNDPEIYSAKPDGSHATNLTDNDDQDYVSAY